jgi:hypothetical protein
MPTTRQTTKTNWSDIGVLRRPNSTWRLGRAARWFEKVLDLPSGTVVFVLPTGRRARRDKKLGSFRAEWDRHR